MASTARSALAAAVLLALLVGGSALPAGSGIASPEDAITVYVSATPQVGSAPLTVWFDGIATGGTPPYLYTWYFNDGTTWTGNNTANVSHVFTVPRQYNTQLVAKDSRGEQGFSPILPIVVIQRDELTIRIDATPRCGPPPLDVLLRSFVVGGVSPYKVSWNFGDGQTGSGPQATHIYSSLGTYFAYGEVTDSDNPPQTRTSNQVEIRVSNSCNQLTVFGDANPRRGPAPLNVQFNGGAQGGQPPYQFTWTFGDGGTAGFPDPMHTYANPGTYQARLEARDSAGASATSPTIEIIVDPPQPGLQVFADAAPRQGEAPLFVQFKSSVTGGQPPYKYEWDLGDGSPMSTIENPSHTYVNPGVYYAYLHASDSSNLDGYSPKIEIIVDKPTNPLIVTSSASPTSGPAPLAVAFDGAASGGSPPYSYLWDFGDGAQDSFPKTSHVYSSPGIYTAVLASWDQAGRKGAAAPIQIDVTSQPLLVVIGASPTSGQQPLTVQFSSSVSGGVPPYTYSWDFGDSTGGTGNQPVHTYFNPGTFYATLTVGDQSGQAVTSAPIQIVVSPRPSQLAVNASASPTSGIAPLTVTFSGGASGGTSPYTYEWVFGDGATGGVPFTSHTYTAAGQYDAYLTAKDSAGQTGYSAPIRIDVQAGRLVASAVGSPTRGPAPLDVQFVSSVSGGTAPFYFAWEFGDGGVSGTQDPMHTYFVPGSYSASVLVRDSGPTPQQTKSNEVVIEVERGQQDLKIAIDASPRSGPATLSVKFTSQVGGGSPPYAYAWTFGDGTTGSGDAPTHAYSTPGIYQAYVEVKDSGGLAGFSLPVDIEVTGGALAAQAYASPLSGPAPLRVDFTGLASGGASPYSFNWEFGDGLKGTGEGVQHTYANPGTYIARLAVVDSAGSGAAASPLSIVVGQPGDFKVSVSASPTSGPAPLGVDFTGTATGAEEPTFQWSFDDGGYGTGPRVFHVYTNPGAYRAVLTVTDKIGRMGLGEKEITVTGDSLVQVVPSPSDWTGPVGAKGIFSVKVMAGRDGDVTAKSEIRWKSPPIGTLSVSSGPKVEFTATGAGKGVVEISATYRGNSGFGRIMVTVGDGEVPAVKITSPANGSEVSGIVRISGTVERLDKIDVVQVSIDGGDWRNGSTTDGWKTWTYASWDTTDFSDGNHKISARAVSGSLLSDSEPVVVRVNNAGGGGPIFTGLPEWWPWAVLAALAVLGSVLLAMVARRKLRPNVAKELAKRDAESAQTPPTQAPPTAGATFQQGMRAVGAPGAGFVSAGADVRRRAIEMAARRRGQPAGPPGEVQTATPRDSRRQAALELARARAGGAYFAPAATAPPAAPAPATPRAAPQRFERYSPGPTATQRSAAVASARARLERIRSQQGQR
jgi:PKD repeat protein